MKYTNYHNLPKTIVEAIKARAYVKVGDYSVTELINPPQMGALKRRHQEVLTKDVSRDIWSLLGSAMHRLLELAGVTNCLKEKQVIALVDGVKIGGTLDMYDLETETLYDYKCVGLYAWQKGNAGNKPWEQQLNIYAWLLTQHGYPPPKKLVNALMLRDWKESETMKQGYPKVQYQEITWEPWPIEKQEAFIKQRLALHRGMVHVHDEGLLHCTDEERWAKHDRWALMKEGSKRATKLYDEKIEAEKEAVIRGLNYYVVHRPGEQTRCERYCDVASVCHQFNKSKETVDA